MSEKNFTPKLLLCCFMIMTLIGCKKENLLETKGQLPDVFSELSEDDIANEQFASVLAKSLTDPAVRRFIKYEALQKPDKDYDVIYQLVKNKTLDNQLTFRETLAQYCESIEELDRITNQDPTLSILVPYLGNNFNAEIWNPEKNETPQVILRNSLLNKDITMLRGYDPNGNPISVERYKWPQIPTLVVKSNERLVTRNEATATKMNATDNCALSNDEGIFAYFSDPEFINRDTINAITKRPLMFWQFFAVDECNKNQQKSVDCFFNNIDSHRDYIYYGIDPGNGINTGRLDNTTAEYLYNITFNSPTSYGIIADPNDPLGDWSDGSFEIYIDLFFNRRSGAAFNLRKVLHIPINELFTLNGNNATSTITYYIIYPLELFTWDNYEYGDTYKMSIFEYDEGTVVTNTHTVSSTFSQNFEVNSGVDFGVVKFGANVGASGTESKTSTVTTQFTNGSDQLGELFVNFYDPIFKGYIRVDKLYGLTETSQSFLPNQKNEFLEYTKNSTFQFAGYKTYNTGTLTISTGPMIKI